MSAHQDITKLQANSISTDERELIQQLLDDVGVIEDQFLVGIPKPAAARTIFAPILRRWIADGLFYKAQKLILPEQSKFPISSNANSIKLCQAGIYAHWMGLVLFGTAGISPAQIAPKYLDSNGRATAQIGESSFHPAPQKASIFFEQKIFFWKGVFYTRSDVIKMQANSLGGVHFDFRTTQSETHIIEIKNYFGFEDKGNNKQMLIGDQINVGRADPSRRQRIYDATELVAMDTARIFANGVRASENAFVALLG